MQISTVASVSAGAGLGAFLIAQGFLGARSSSSERADGGGVTGGHGMRHAARLAEHV